MPKGEKYEMGQFIAEAFVEELEDWSYPVTLDGVTLNNAQEALSEFVGHIRQSPTADPEALDGFLSKFD